jgi:hypothetical protein
MAKTATPNRRICWASLIAGGALAAIAVAAMSIDLSNNVRYGAKTSTELAAIMGLAAIGVTALPAAAALRKWDLLLRSGTAACVALTIWAAISAYAERQGAEILARQAAQDAYQAAQIDAAVARREIASARAEAARIAEASTPADLEKLANYHREQIRIETEDRGGCGIQCRKHEEELEAVLARLPQARARETALARVSAAQGRLDRAESAAKAGPAEASMLATVIARRTGHDAPDIARTIALATTGFAIIATIMMAGLAHQAAALILQGLGLRPRPAGKGTATTNREDAAEPVATGVATPCKPGCNPVATGLNSLGKAPIKAKKGGRNYWLTRLQREFPDVAERVAAGEMSCYAACVATGLRKAPAKRKDWGKIEAYAKPIPAEA